MKICVQQIDDIISKIHAELKAINNEISHHKEKRYLAKWRIPNYGDNIQRLKCYSRILDERKLKFVKLYDAFYNKSASLVENTQPKLINIPIQIDHQRISKSDPTN